MRRESLHAAGRVVGPLVLVLIAVGQLAPGLRLDLSPPMSWDHGAHLGKAILTWRELLPSLRGWSDSIETGVPLNTLYSIGGTAFLLATRLVTPFLEWHQTYALALCAFRALVGLSVYRLARAAGATRTGATLAGVVALADHGDHSEGGWFYDIQFGVWPMSLAMACFGFGLARVADARSELDTRATTIAALAFAAALVSHQMALVGLLVLAPILVLSRWLDTALDRRIARIAIACAFAVVIAGFWLVPMMAGAGEMSRHGQLYRSLDELGAGAATGAMVLRGGPYTVVLAAIAVLVAVFTTGTRRFFGLSVAILVLVSSRDWLVSLGALRVAPSLGSIMYPRFLMLAKPLEFALIGCLIDDIRRPATEAVVRELASLRGRVAIGIAFAAVGPFAPGIIRASYEAIVVRDGAWAATSTEWRDLQSYAAWERRHAGEPFYRVAYLLPTTHLAQAAPAYTGRPSHKMGMLIAEVFANTTQTSHPDALRAMNVRRIVHSAALPPVLGAQTHVVARFGSIVVSDLDGWTSAVVTDRVSGGPLLAALRRDRITVELHGARSIVVHRAFSSRFRAEADGRPVRIAPISVPHASPLRFMRVDVPVGARRVVVSYPKATWLEIASAIASIAALVVLLVPRLRRSTESLVDSGVDRARDFARRHLASTRSRWLAAIGAIVLVAAPIVARVAPFDARRAWSDARVAIVGSDGTRRPCEGERRDGSPGIACPDYDWLYVAPVIQPIGGELRECVWSHPPALGERLRVEFDDVPTDREFVLGAGISDEAGLSETDTVEFRVRFGSDPETSLIVGPHEWREVRLRSGSAATAIVEITAQSAARRFACFNLRSAR